MATNEPIKLTRQQLYDQVWSEPMTKLSKKYGLSDVGLAKVCKRNNIPRPPIGYWAKKIHGKSIDQIPLPPHAEEKPICFHAQFGGIGVEDPKLPDKVQRLIGYELDPSNLIAVPNRLSSPHTLTKKIRQNLEKGEPDRYDMINSACAPQIWVSKKTIPRALRIMDTLVKALDERGFLCGIFEQPLSYGIFEVLNSEMSDYGKEQMKKERHPTRHLFYYKRWASGRLKLAVITGMDWHGKGIQRNWTDGKNQRIENCLNEFICGLIRWAAIDQELHLRREREHKEYEEKERQRKERARRVAQEQARKDQLRADARAWERSKNLRCYIDAVIEKEGPIQPESELEKWVAWARAEADLDDPLC